MRENDDFGDDKEDTDIHIDPEDGTDFPDDNTSDDGDSDTDGSDNSGKKKRVRYVVEGIPVRVVNEAVEYLDANGNLITKSIIDYSRANLRRLYPYFDEFRKVWLAQKRKQELLNKLVSDGVFVDFVKETLPKDHVDDYDVLSYIGYDIEPLTKEERIERILVSGYLDKFSKENQDIIKLLLEAYRDHDIDELTNLRILNMPEFIQKGTAKEILGSFGGREKYIEMLNEIEMKLYAA